jgi:tetratricopeptide (TPR) repeat protein
MTADKARQRADLIAEDERIDALIARQNRLLAELNATVAEHWLYLPSVGFLIFVIGCVLDLPVRYRSVMAGCACCAAVALSVRSTIRSSDWSTEEIFYRRTLAAGGRSSRILANLGQVYANRGEFAKAEAIYRNVLRLCPDYPIARSNLAEVLLREGHKKEAQELLASTSKATETTRKEYPRTWVAVLNLALSYHREKNDAEALAIAEKARHDYPGVWEIIRFEADILRQTRGPDAGIPLVEAFVHDNWWHYGAAIALGQLYAEKGDVPRAEANRAMRKVATERSRPDSGRWPPRRSASRLLRGGSAPLQAVGLPRAPCRRSRSRSGSVRRAICAGRLSPRAWPRQVRTRA